MIQVKGSLDGSRVAQKRWMFQFFKFPTTALGVGSVRKKVVELFELFPTVSVCPLRYVTVIRMLEIRIF